MSQTRKPQSIFPDYPRESPVIDKNGDLNARWDLAFSSLFQGLQRNFKNEGIVFPPLSASEIATIQAIYTPLIGNPLPQGVPDISGQTIFDLTNRVPKQFIITYDNASPPNITQAIWMMINVMTFHAGNPNGNVGAVLNWFCYNTTGHVLYICTTAGNAASAVWTPI